VLTPEDIHSEFRKVRAGIDHRPVPESAALDGFPSDIPLDGPHAKRQLDEISELLDAHPRFSERFDFSWATDPASYSISLELTLQAVLIAALADSDQDHPDLARLRPTVVRCVMNPQFSSTCISADEVDFICISQGFIKFMQIFVGSMIDFHDIGRWIHGETKLADTNLVFGQDAERTLRTVPEAGKEICQGIVNAGFNIAGGEHVSHHSTISERLADDIGRHAPTLVIAMIACEGFIVCHELAHFLKGHKQKLVRSIDDEVGADESGTSLLIVASATLKPLPAGTLFGPPVFFQLARLYEMMHRVRAMMYEPGDVSKFIASENELKLRMKLTGRYIAKHIPMPHERSPYWEIVNEIGVVIRGCQLYMLEVFTKEKRDFDSPEEEPHLYTR